MKSFQRVLFIPDSLTCPFCCVSTVIFLRNSKPYLVSAFCSCSTGIWTWHFIPFPHWNQQLLFLLLRFHISYYYFINLITVTSPHLTLHQLLSCCSSSTQGRTENLRGTKNVSSFQGGSVKVLKRLLWLWKFAFEKNLILHYSFHKAWNFIFHGTGETKPKG